MASGKKYQIDMCHGPIFSKIIIFTIPLIAANVMATLFNSADMIVVGRFANSQALAAVGATNGLTALVLNLFFGLSSGISVLATRFIGAKDNKSLNRVVHTAIAVAAYGGTAMAILGILISRPVLQLMELRRKFSTRRAYICGYIVPGYRLSCFTPSAARFCGQQVTPAVRFTT